MSLRVSGKAVAIGEAAGAHAPTRVAAAKPGGSGAPVLAFRQAGRHPIGVASCGPRGSAGGIDRHDAS